MVGAQLPSFPGMPEPGVYQSDPNDLKRVRKLCLARNPAPTP